jgi:hypothetical protein
VCVCDALINFMGLSRALQKFRVFSGGEINPSFKGINVNQ